MHRRIRHVIFVIETSESMSGEPINSINEGMREAIEILRVGHKETEIDYRIGVITQSNLENWRTEMLTPADMYQWNDLQISGFLPYGKVFALLSKRFTIRDLFASTMRLCRPVIVFIGIGISTDDYEGPLQELGSNGWFQNTDRLFIKVGDTNSPMPLCIVNYAGAVFNAVTGNEIKERIRYVTQEIITHIVIGPDSCRENKSEWPMKGIDTEVDPNCFDGVIFDCEEFI